MTREMLTLADAILYGQHELAVSLTGQALSAGVAPSVIIRDGLTAGMSVVAQKLRANEFYVPEVLIATRAMQACMARLKPHMDTQSERPLGTVVIGTVQGDLHDIGKNLVAMLLHGNGFTVVDLGVDVTPERFVEAAKALQADIVALSSLLTTTMPAMRETVEALEAAGLRARVKVLIGGAPVSQRFADAIGAHGYAPDAASSPAIAKALLHPPGAACDCPPQADLL